MKKYDFHLYRGDDKNFLIRLKLKDNSSLDILNSRFILQARKTEETTISNNNRVNHLAYQTGGLPNRRTQQFNQLPQDDFNELKRKSDLPLLFTLSTENKKIKVMNNGNLVIMFDHNDTDNATWKEAEYDLQLITPRNKYKTIMKGKIILDKDLTE
nr:MAG TPA: hypothetical protein [Caudoviricetes sp.]